MSKTKRVIAVAAVGLPIMFGAPAMALADDGGKKPTQNQHQHQGQDANTEQSNDNNEPITQVNVGGKGDQSVEDTTNQTNASGTEQSATQEAAQLADKHKGKGKH